MENQGEKKGRIKKLLGQLFGWVCLVVGILGIFLPFLQGVILILLGVIFLSATYPKLRFWIEKEFAKSEFRHPKVAKILKGIEIVYIRLVRIIEGKKGL